METTSFQLCAKAIPLKPLSISELRAMLPVRNINEPTMKITERRYRPGVLEGNWFEDNAKYKLTRDEWATMYQATYRPHKTENFNEKFEAWNHSIDAQGIGHELLLEHRRTANDDMITTYDAMFTVPRKGIRGSKSVPPEQSGNGDSTQTQTDIRGARHDLVGHKYSKRFVRNVSPIHRRWQSSYKDGFPKHEVASESRFTKPKAELNKPDLRHLGIDLAACPNSYPISCESSSVPMYGHMRRDKLSKRTIFAN